MKKLDEKDFIRHKLYAEKKSILKKYSDLVIGGGSLVSLLKYEMITTFISPLPGALGLIARKIFYPFIIREIGTGTIIGKSVTIRNPANLYIKNRVVIDDYCTVDARGSGQDRITIGDDVFIGRGCIVQSKVGSITIGSQTSIGANSVIIAQGDILIGDMVNIAGGCYISGGTYQIARDGSSPREHGKFSKGPIQIDPKCRIGMGAMVLDGTLLGEGTILGAMSMASGDFPPYCVAAGIPAEVKYFRKDKSDSPA